MSGEDTHYYGDGCSAPHGHGSLIRPYDVRQSAEALANGRSQKHMPVDVPARVACVACGGDWPCVSVST